jgi:hypothetical protein
LTIDHLNDLAESNSLSKAEANVLIATLVQFWQENPSYEIEESVLSFFISAVVFFRRGRHAVATPGFNGQT